MQPVYVSAESRSELLSLCMARDSWSHALDALRQLIALGSDSDPTNYDVLLTAACVLYMRPFEKSHGLIRLEQYLNFDGLANSEDLRRTHEAVDKTRNQIMAHQQVSGWDKLLKGVPDALPAHRLIVRLGAGHPMSYEISAPTLRPEFLSPFAHLVSVQHGRANHDFFQAVVPLLPSSFTGLGEFSIELRPQSTGPVSIG